MQPQPGLVEGVRDVVVELLVLLVGDLRLRPRPECGGGVDGALLLGQADGYGDVVAVGLDHLTQAVRIEVFLLVLLDVQRDPRAPRRCRVALGDGEFALALGDPAPALVLAGLAGLDHDLVGDHEGGIETDAELADQAGAVFPVFHRLQELGGAGAGDGAEVLDQLLAAHADAVVGDGERAGLLVAGEHDRKLRVGGGERGVGQRQVAQTVAGIGTVGDELA